MRIPTASLILIAAGIVVVAIRSQNNGGRAIPPLNSSEFSPSNLPSMTYWWVFTDVATNDAVISSWPARVGTSTFEQASAALRPTNTSSGMSFGAGTRLTNNPLATVNFGSGTKATYWLVLTPTTPVSATGAIISDQTGDHNLCTESDNQYTYQAASGGAGNLGVFVSGSTFDLALVVTNIGINACYTNTVVNFVRATASLYDENQRFIGGDPFGENFIGKIREFAIFSDALTVSNLTQLHNYATNLYGYAP